MSVKKALTIAGSDSGAGAGIQADLKTFAALGVYGTSVITAVTAQNTREVRAIHPIPSEVVAQQLEAVLTDIGADAVKTGMLANQDIIVTVAARLRDHGPIPLVVDPVMVSKAGVPLLEPPAIAALRRELFPLAAVVTPNVPEAEALLGRTLKTEEQLLKAGREMLAMGPKAVLIKGGHREPGSQPAGPDDRNSSSGEVVDLYFCAEEEGCRISGPRIATPHTHGTGCTLAAAIAAYLARGESSYPAILRARSFLTAALKAAFPVGQGKGPVHHFHRWWTAGN
ncbi:MAG: bifunctional hydroxymethylpyrimidine kinase/phosphomethylpyrimidine kinase [Acidobacteriota bacterium]